MSNTYTHKMKAKQNIDFRKQCKINRDTMGWLFQGIFITYDYEYISRRIPKSKADKYKYYRWFAAEPRWWRNMHHTRPRRRANKKVCRDIVNNADVDYAYPLDHKPHFYYW